MTEQDLINESYIEGKKSFDFLVRKLFEDFNFNIVHDTMIFLKWNWAMGEYKGIPDLETIKKVAFDILEKAYNEEKTISTGGFKASYNDDLLTLEFTIMEGASD